MKRLVWKASRKPHDRECAWCKPCLTGTWKRIRVSFGVLDQTENRISGQAETRLRQRSSLTVPAVFVFMWSFGKTKLSAARTNNGISPLAVCCSPYAPAARSAADPPQAGKGVMTGRTRVYSQDGRGLRLLRGAQAFSHSLSSSAARITQARRQQTTPSCPFGTFPSRKSTPRSPTVSRKARPCFLRRASEHQLDPAAVFGKTVDVFEGDHAQTATVDLERDGKVDGRAFADWLRRRGLRRADGRGCGSVR